MLTYTISEAGVTSLHGITVDRRVLGIPVETLDSFALGRSGWLRDQLRAWHFHRLWQEEHIRAEVWCRWLPFALILRAYHWLTQRGWRFVRALYWVGLFDVAPGERLTWGGFYRIKSR